MAFTVSVWQTQNPIDWFGLADPFTQTTPLKITNNYSGTLWFQGQLSGVPPTQYSAYSGVQMGSVNSGASSTLNMTWNVSVSGRIDTSSPVTDTLSLQLLAFTSSNYTGPAGSGNTAITNFLFSRYSGMIKVFGDIYSNDQPTPSASQAAGGTLNQSGTYTYGISYVRSGWESDIGAPSISVTLNSGFGTVAVSWSSVGGAAQYYVWRWSGSADYTLYSGNTTPNAGTLRPMDLLTVTTALSYTDNGTAPTQTGLYRHRSWQMYGNSGAVVGSVMPTDATIYFSPPQSRQGTGVTNRRQSHAYQLNKNTSGTSLLGPYYHILHLRQNETTLSGQANFALALSQNVDGSTSGTETVDENGLINLASATWYRFVTYISGTSSSGYIHSQVFNMAAVTLNYDDVFVVALS